jgi:murein DD-endopeptidase MepM/ murein hydrolase activator NlpD
VTEAKLFRPLALQAMRRAVAFLVGMCVLMAVVPGDVVRAEDTPAEQAAKEIADAREQANAAADAYFDAESRLDSLGIEAQALEAEVADLEGQVAALQEKVQRVAINRFTRSDTTTSPLLNGFSTPEEQMQLEALSEVITDTSARDFDLFESLNRQLTKQQRALVDKRDETEQQKATAAALRDTATAEVEQLKDVEAGRLKDEAVKKALQAEERARAADAAEAASMTSTTDDADRSTDVDVDGGSAAPQTTALNSLASGGQTGAGGAGGRPGGAGGNVYGGVDWVCPTGDWPVSFGDTWGAPRSGGRRHEGVDMIGPIGVPILAVVDGFATARSAELGGLVLTLVGNDGNRYFMGHLDSYGKLGAVQAGDVIAYMGQTGNARFSVSHLHIEIHPAGGPAVNLYPTVRAYC